jgi:hypothetical protein
MCICALLHVATTTTMPTVLGMGMRLSLLTIENARLRTLSHRLGAVTCDDDYETDLVRNEQEVINANNRAWQRQKRKPHRRSTPGLTNNSMFQEYVGTLRSFSDLNYSFNVVCAFDAATRGRWRAAKKTAVDHTALCVDFLLCKGVATPRESEPAPERSSSTMVRRAYLHTVAL